jgi:hypothetical protein
MLSIEASMQDMSAENEKLNVNSDQPYEVHFIWLRTFHLVK